MHADVPGGARCAPKCTSCLSYTEGCGPRRTFWACSSMYTCEFSYLELGMPESTVREFWHPHDMMFYSAHELLRRNIATVITDLDLKSPDCAFSC